MESEQPPLGRILTFYSYKGGTGRSMALANVAWMLASAGRRVLAIDWDLEAPGLHRYFRPFLIDDEVMGSEGLIDLVDDYANEAIRPVQDGAPADPDWYIPYTDFSKHVVSVNFAHFPAGGKIDFLPAGRQGDHYALAVSSFNWQNFYDRLGGGGFFEALKRRARAKYDYVLIDSRTGVSDTAGICSVQMPDTLVVCFTYNNQSIKGAAAVAGSAIAMHKKLVDEQLALRRSGKSSVPSSALENVTRPYRVFPVPMRVDDGESDRLAIRQAFARSSFESFVAHISPNLIDEYWKAVEVPYRVFYAYEEVLAPFKDDPRDPKSLLASQIRLMRYVTDNDVSDFALLISPEERRKHLNAFAATPLTRPATAAQQPTEGTSHETDEQAMARKAESALAALSGADRVLAKRVLLRLVRVGPDDEGGGYFPIRTRLGEFREPERRAVEHLAAHGILTVATEPERRGSARQEAPSSDRAPDLSVGLADPRLLKTWPTLIAWLDQDREFLFWQQQLRVSLALWVRSDADPGSLLSGRALAEADLMMRRRRDDLADSEIDYIVQSRDAAVMATPSEAEPVPARRPIRTGVAVVAVLLTLGIAAASWQLMKGAPPATSTVPVTSTVQVPQFVGLTSAQAKAMADARGLTVKMSDGAVQDQAFIQGVVVVSQTPIFESIVPAGDVIRLVVSQATISVPQLVGIDLPRALQLLESYRLKLGKTDSRYVPRAPIDSVVAQQPDPGAKVAAETLVEVTVARPPKLSDFRIGIYFVDKDSAAAATAISAFLISKGQQVLLFPRPPEFFLQRGQPKQNQIRYSSASEGKPKDELQQLLKEGGFGVFRPVTTVNTTDGFLSLFLVDYPVRK